MKKILSVISAVVILTLGFPETAMAKRMSRSFAKPRVHRVAPNVAKRQMLPARSQPQTMNNTRNQTTHNQQDANFQHTSQTQRMDNSNIRSNLLSGGAGLAAGYMLGSMNSSPANAQTVTPATESDSKSYQQPIAMPELSSEEQLMESLLSIQRNTDALLQAGKITPMQAESIQFYRQKIYQELQQANLNFQ